jgi:uncharacterized protein
MSAPIASLDELLASMRPVLNEGVYVFASAPLDMDLSTLAVISTFREREGLTIIAEEHEIRRTDLPILFRASWITLGVHSDLNAVGFTAAVAHALAAVNISANIVAAAYHDHLFVPVECAKSALAQLEALQRRAQEAASSGASVSP